MDKRTIAAIAARIAAHTTPETYAEFAERINAGSGWTVERSAPLGGILRTEGIVLNAWQLDDAVELGIRLDAETRVDNDPRLASYRATILYDWPEGRQHLEWVATAPVAEIVSWAKAVEAGQ